VGPDANAVALGVAGDDAYWLVPALSPETGDPHSFDFSRQLVVVSRADKQPAAAARPE
jgi:hypothetical protein